MEIRDQPFVCEVVFHAQRESHGMEAKATV